MQVCDRESIQTPGRDRRRHVNSEYAAYLITGEEPSIATLFGGKFESAAAVGRQDGGGHCIQPSAFRRRATTRVCVCRQARRVAAGLCDDRTIARASDDAVLACLDRDRRRLSIVRSAAARLTAAKGAINPRPQRWSLTRPDRRRWNSESFMSRRSRMRAKE
jgi:hypothetical protein